MSSQIAKEIDEEYRKKKAFSKKIKERKEQIKTVQNKRKANDSEDIKSLDSRINTLLYR